MSTFMSKKTLQKIMSNVKPELHQKEQIMETNNDTEIVKDLWYEGEKFEVKFHDYDGNVINTQDILYKQGVNNPPTLETKVIEDAKINSKYDAHYTKYMNFTNWDKNLTSITSNTNVYPEYTDEFLLNGYIMGDDNGLNQDNYWNYTLDDENNIITLTRWDCLKKDSNNNYLSDQLKHNGLIDHKPIDRMVVKDRYYVKSKNKWYKTKVYNYAGTTYNALFSVGIGNSYPITILFGDKVTFALKNALYLFGNCGLLTSINFNNHTDFSNIAMSGMFYCCKQLTEIIGLNKFKTTGVELMAYMFNNCSSLTSLDLTSFDTHNVTEMENMFKNCTNLTEIKVSRSKWVINDNCNTTDMFTGCGVDHVTYVD